MHAAHGIDFLVPLRAGLVRSRNCAANGVELLSYIPELHIMASADRLFGKAFWADSIDTYGTITYHVWNANSLHMNTSGCPSAMRSVCAANGNCSAVA